MKASMTMDKTLFQHAQAVLNRHGLNAENYATSMLLHHLHRQNRDQASRWLQIGHAIEMLTDLAAAGPTQ
jgi:hypothetical protein